MGPSLVAASLQALHGIFPVHASVPDIYPCNRDTGHIGLTATRITSFSYADFSEAYLTQVTVRAPGNLDFLVTFLGELDSTCNKAQAQTERCRGRNQLRRGLHNSSGGGAVRTATPSGPWMRGEAPGPVSTGVSVRSGQAPRQVVPPVTCSKCAAC